MPDLKIGDYVLITQAKDGCRNPFYEGRVGRVLDAEIDTTERLSVAETKIKRLEIVVVGGVSGFTRVTLNDPLFFAEGNSYPNDEYERVDERRIAELGEDVLKDYKKLSSTDLPTLADTREHALRVYTSPKQGTAWKKTMKEHKDAKPLPDPNKPGPRCASKVA